MKAEKGRKKRIAKNVTLGIVGSSLLSILIGIVIDTAPMFNGYRRPREYFETQRGFVLGWVIIALFFVGYRIYRGITKKKKKEEEAKIACYKEPQKK